MHVEMINLANCLTTHGTGTDLLGGCRRSAKQGKQTLLQLNRLIMIMIIHLPAATPLCQSWKQILESRRLSWRDQILQQKETAAIAEANPWIHSLLYYELIPPHNMHIVFITIPPFDLPEISSSKTILCHFLPALTPVLGRYIVFWYILQ